MQRNEIIIIAVAAALAVAAAVTIAVVLSEHKKKKGGSITPKSKPKSKPKPSTLSAKLLENPAIHISQWTFDSFKLGASNGNVFFADEWGPASETTSAFLVWNSMPLSEFGKISTAVDKVQDQAGFPMMVLGVGKLSVQFSKSKQALGGAAIAGASIAGSSVTVGSESSGNKDTILLSNTIMLLGAKDTTSGDYIPGTGVYMVLVDPAGAGGYFLVSSSTALPIKGRDVQNVAWGERMLTDSVASSVPLGAVSVSIAMN